MRALPNSRFSHCLNGVLFVLAVLISTLSISSAQSTSTEWFGSTVPSDNPVTVQVLSSDPSEIRISIELEGVFLNYHPSGGCEPEIPGEGQITASGLPSLPQISRLIAIPPEAIVDISCETFDQIVRQDISVSPTAENPIYDLDADFKFVYDADIYNSHQSFPAAPAEISAPAIMCGVRLIRLTVNPLTYNPAAHTLTLTRHIEVTLSYSPGGTKNVLPPAPRKIPRSFAPILSSLVINYPQIDWEVDEQWGTLLIIAPDNTAVLSALQPLIAWKQRRGFSVQLATLTQTGSSASQIQSYIQNVYDNSDPQLTYLILIGDCVGSVAVPASNAYGDHDYSRLDGDDVLADIGVGRFSCANTTQLMTEVNKIVTYESTPYMGQTDWYKKAAVTAPLSSSGFSTIQTKQAVKYKALINGYTTIDTLFYNMAGSFVTFTTNAINDGINFFNYRGYIGMNGWSNTNTNNLINYFKLPFVVTITCDTGDITSSASGPTEEFFRVGTPTTPKGAIAAIGTATHGTHTRHNNCVDIGIFSAFFDYHVYGMGDALNMGKYYLYINYPYNPTSVEEFSDWNNLIGDPSCQLWTDIPQRMSVEFSAALPAGAADYTVAVTDFNTGQPLPGVDVCLQNADFTYFIVTGDDGIAQFTFEPLPAGEILLTCTKHNFIPKLSTVIVQNQPVYVNYTQIALDDDQIGFSFGDNDSLINPGETIELSLALQNYGQSSTAQNLTATVTCSHPAITFLDSLGVFPDLPPQSSSPLLSEFVFTIAPDAVNLPELNFNLQISSTQGIWNSLLPLSIAAPDLEFAAYTVPDANAQIDPGELTQVVISLVNIGLDTAFSMISHLQSENEYLQVVQPAGIPQNIPPGFASSDTFQVYTSPYTLPGCQAACQMIVTALGGFIDTINFDLTLGLPETSDPLGPDEYGYYALDNTDTAYIGAPDYNWVEIDPTVPGHIFTGIFTNLSDYGYEQDASVVVNLPFTFSFYGADYTQIAVCSNGWIGFGAEIAYFTNFRNWVIPSAIGPYNIAAPFWDDLYQTLSPARKIYYYYDSTAHRFIVEWNVLNWAPGNFPEKFQVILLDPAYYPTATGDGEILFQYLDIINVFSAGSDNHFSTIGIKDLTGLVGLQYSYWNYFPPGAAPLADGLAIKFTTTVPQRLEMNWIRDLQISVSGEDVVLNWNSIPGASIYRIYRSETPDFDPQTMTPLAQISINQYTDTSALEASQFFYCVTWE